LYSATGRVADLSAEQSMLIQVDAGFVLEGSSGSPVLTDAGTVVGILYGEVTGPNLSGPHHVAVTAQALKTMCP
jgi:hypothetical protein